jgi:hypothetical protein
MNGKKSNDGFWVARGELTAPGTIRPILCIRGIRVPPLNLDARTTQLPGFESNL